MLLSYWTFIHMLLSYYNMIVYIVEGSSAGLFLHSPFYTWKLYKNIYQTIEVNMIFNEKILIYCSVYFLSKNNEKRKEYNPQVFVRYKYISIHLLLLIRIEIKKYTQTQPIFGMESWIKNIHMNLILIEHVNIPWFRVNVKEEECLVIAFSLRFSYFTLSLIIAISLSFSYSLTLWLQLLLIVRKMFSLIEQPQPSRTQAEENNEHSQKITLGLVLDGDFPLLKPPSSHDGLIVPDINSNGRSFRYSLNCIVTFLYISSFHIIPCKVAFK